MVRHKVVLVPFPFDDLSAAKLRPAVCLTEPTGPHRHVVIAFITSRLPATLLPTDLVIDSKDGDFAATGLRVTSTLQVHRMVTVSVGIIQRELGQLPARLHTQVDERLRRLFALS